MHSLPTQFISLASLAYDRSLPYIRLTVAIARLTLTVATIALVYFVLAAVTVYRLGQSFAQWCHEFVASCEASTQEDDDPDLTSFITAIDNAIKCEVLGVATDVVTHELRYATWENMRDFLSSLHVSSLRSYAKSLGYVVSNKTQAIANISAHWHDR